MRVSLSLLLAIGLFPVNAASAAENNATTTQTDVVMQLQSAYPVIAPSEPWLLSGFSVYLKAPNPATTAISIRENTRGTASPRAFDPLYLAA